MKSAHLWRARVMKKSWERKILWYEKVSEFSRCSLFSQSTLNASKNAALQIAFQISWAFDMTFQMHIRKAHAKTSDLIDREINSQDFLNHFLHSICFNSFTYMRDAKLSEHADENSSEHANKNSSEHACEIINEMTDETLLSVSNRESSFTIRRSWNKRVMSAICSAKKSKIMLS